nr:MAG TPA: hypothetical protein [Caudoviricetes sp.]
MGLTTYEKRKEIILTCRLSQPTSIYYHVVE